MTNQIKTSTPLPHRRQYHHMDNIEEETRIPLPSPQAFRRAHSLRLRGSSSYHNDLSLSPSLANEDTIDFKNLPSLQVKSNPNSNIQCSNFNTKTKSTLTSSRSLQSFNTESSNNSSGKGSHCNGATTSCHNHVIASHSSKKLQQQQNSPILQNESISTLAKSSATTRRDHGMVS